MLKGKWHLFNDPYPVTALLPKNDSWKSEVLTIPSAEQELVQLANLDRMRIPVACEKCRGWPENEWSVQGSRPRQSTSSSPLSPSVIPDLSALVMGAAPFDPRLKMHHFRAMKLALLGGLGGPWSTHNFIMEAPINFKFSGLIPQVLHFLTVSRLSRYVLGDICLVRETNLH